MENVINRQRMKRDEAADKKYKTANKLVRNEEMTRSEARKAVNCRIRAWTRAKHTDSDSDSDSDSGQTDTIDSDSRNGSFFDHNLVRNSTDDVECFFDESCSLSPSFQPIILSGNEDMGHFAASHRAGGTANHDSM